MKRLIYILLIVVCSCSTTISAQTEISITEFGEKFEILFKKIFEDYEKKDYLAGEKLTNEVISLYNLLSKENQENYKEIQANMYYQLACLFSLQYKKDEAIDTLKKAIELGWKNYSHTNNDSDLDNIRNDQEFKTLLQDLREISDYHYILMGSEGYQKADTTGLPHFTYEDVSSSNLKSLRKFFNLDSIAGEGDEISQILNLLKWVHDNIRHNGNNFTFCEFDAIDLYNYCKTTGEGVNCRLLAISLNEVYLSMGFKSRYITGMPKKLGNAHVINCVYSTTLKKWLWMDPTMNAYWRDENGNFLSIEEVRERYIEGLPLILNDDANWNNERKETKESYLDNWMSEYLYWFSCPINSRFNPESPYRNDDQLYINLCPLGYERSILPNVKSIATNDAAYFWEN